MVIFITELLVQAFIICSLQCLIRQGWRMNGWKAVTRRGERAGYEITGTHCSLDCVQSAAKVFSLALALGTVQVF